MKTNTPVVIEELTCICCKTLEVLHLYEVIVEAKCVLSRMQPLTIRNKRWGRNEWINEVLKELVKEKTHHRHCSEERKKELLKVSKGILYSKSWAPPFLAQKIPGVQSKHLRVPLVFFWPTCKMLILNLLHFIWGWCRHFWSAWEIFLTSVLQIGACKLPLKSW